ncbi:MAG: arginine deiminase-related protein, partial [Kangiellaceae bacterium]|nr:arginine deiminase-related protein [Kangiellaceae bacterium]
MGNCTQNHLTDAIIMVRPIDFGFNEQTGQDNEFQHKPDTTQTEAVRAKANQEFEQMVAKIKSRGISVTVLEKKHTTDQLPDAVFPNNWFSTRENGEIFVYPMKTINRQAEVQIEQLQSAVTQEGFDVKRITDFRGSLAHLGALEGTGSLIFHHPTGRLFAAISERCTAEALKQFAEQNRYELIAFQTQSTKGAPIYHTNVLMSCGEDFIVICEEVLAADPQSQAAMEVMKKTVKDLIIISEQQMTENFCGNIIQVKNQKGQPAIIMSASAFNGFT